jgi:hypothetical protein
MQQQHVEQAMTASANEIGRLRIVVAYLGEKGQHDWWPSEFFSPNAPAFLAPVFAKTTPLAQYQGAKEAARRVHDEHLGIGRVFHLFRLPESIEQAVFEVLQDPANADALRSDIESQDAAVAALLALAAGNAINPPNPQPAQVQQGPIQMGTALDLDGARWLSSTAHCYQAAFTAGVRSFPYLVDRE